MSFNPNNKYKCHAFNKDIYFLGQDNNGINYWLEQATWDCDWYWGFGYIESYTNNNAPWRAKDIQSHEHFDGLTSNQNINLYDAFKNKFVLTPFSDKEIWTLCELMKSFYTAQKYAEMLHLGGSHYTTNPCKDTIIATDEKQRINTILIPTLCSEIYKIMTP